MSGKCLDIGTIQAFLDGETRPEEAVRISDHVADCDTCTLLLAQAEEESSLVFSVLDRELNTLVPTQRLWSRINAEISDGRSRASLWQRFLGSIAASLMSPSFAGAAAILLVVGVLSVVWLDRTANFPASGVVATVEAPASSPAAEPSAILPVATTGDDTALLPPPTSKAVVRETKLPESELKRIINANYVERGPKKISPVPASSRYIPGEESYIKTISELEQNVTAQNASMKASGQVAFQRDMAVVDDAIQKMRSVVQKNPSNQAARQILYSSYQDKIDLLKSSAQRDELMASLQ